MRTATDQKIQAANIGSRVRVITPPSPYLSEPKLYWQFSARSHRLHTPSGDSELGFLPVQRGKYAKLSSSRERVSTRKAFGSSSSQLAGMALPETFAVQLHFQDPCSRFARIEPPIGPVYNLDPAHSTFQEALGHPVHGLLSFC